MTKRIIFILLAVFWGLGLQAQTVEKMVPIIMTQYQ